MRLDLNVSLAVAHSVNKILQMNSQRRVLRIKQGLVLPCFTLFMSLCSHLIFLLPSVSLANRNH